MSNSLSRWSRRARTHARRVVYTLSPSSVGPPSREGRGGREDRAAAPVTRAPPGGASFIQSGGESRKGAKKAREAFYPIARRCLFGRRARRAGNLPSERRRGGRPSAGQWFFEPGSRMGRRAKDKRLARHAFPAGTEDSSSARDAGDDQDIPVIPESRNRVLRWSPAPFLMKERARDARGPSGKTLRSCSFPSLASREEFTVPRIGWRRIRHCGLSEGRKSRLGLDARRAT